MSINKIVALEKGNPLNSNGADIAQTINNLVDINIKFSTVSAMKLSSSTKEGDVITTLGYHEIGDDGFASYKVYDPLNVPSHIIVDEYGNHTLGNGKVAVLIPKEAGCYSVEQYGAKGDVIDGAGSNDMLPIRAALAQAKSTAQLQTSVQWETMTGGIVKLGAKNYGLLVTQADIDAGLNACLNISARIGLRGEGRNSTTLTCLDNFGPVPVIANESHNEPSVGYDDFISLGGFQILGRYYHGTNCNASYGIRLKTAMDGYVRTDNFARVSDILIENVEGIGVSASGRGEQVWVDVQANHCKKGLVFGNLVDSHFIGCNAGGNRTVGIQCYKTASCKFTNCKSYYNGSDGVSRLETSNWYLHGDTWVSGRTTFSQCESQESRGAGFSITNGGNLFVNCISADPKRETIGTSPDRVDNSVCWYIGRENSSWSESISMDNHFVNCHATPNLTTNYGNLEDPAYMGDGAVHIDSGCKGNTGNITVCPRVKTDNDIVTGNGLHLNPLLYIMNKPLEDITPPSATTIFYENKKDGIKIHGNPVSEQIHKVLGHRTLIDSTTEVFTDVDSGNLIKGLTNGTAYNFDTTSFSYVGRSPVDTQSFTRSITRDIPRLDGTNGFACDKKLIDLDQPIVRFFFTVGDRTTDTLQTLLYQEGDDGVELFLGLYNKNRLRVNFGGEQIDGMGSAYDFENGTFEVVLYPTGIEVYQDGGLRSSSGTFVRGSVRGGTNTKTYFGVGSASFAGHTPLAGLGLQGQLLGFESDVANILFNNPVGNQQIVGGDLSTVVTEYGDLTTSWEDAPLKV